MPTLLDQLMPFESALNQLRRQGVLPTHLGSADLAALGRSFHRDNFTSARTLLTDLLDQYKADVQSLLDPVITQRPDRVTPENPQGNVTTGLDPATARLRAKELLKELGYSPDPQERGTLKDLSSDARINLVIKTQTETKQGAGAYLQGADPAVLEAFPCWELYRLESKKTTRDWPSRFRLAAQIAGDTDAARVLDATGRMIARKDSPLWDELGSQDNFDDGLQNPYPPFAFNSGMWTRNVAYDEAEQLGFVNLNTQIPPAALDLENLFGVAA